jgi:hypothetical protein
VIEGRHDPDLSFRMLAGELYPAVGDRHQCPAWDSTSLQASSLELPRDDKGFQATDFPWIVRYTMISPSFRGNEATRGSGESPSVRRREWRGVDSPRFTLGRKPLNTVRSLAMAGVSLPKAAQELDPAEHDLRTHNPSLGFQGIGICLWSSSPKEYGYEVKVLVGHNPKARPGQVRGVPIKYIELTEHPSSLLLLLGLLDESVPIRRPLVCGLEVQNLDRDRRLRLLEHFAVTVGTLGCFVKLPFGGNAIVTTRHSMSDDSDREGAAAKEHDDVLSPAALEEDPRKLIGRIWKLWPDGKLATGDPDGSEERPREHVSAEIAVALLNSDVQFKSELIDLPGPDDIGMDSNSQSVSPSRAIKGMGDAEPGMVVLKAGRSSGITVGMVSSISNRIKVLINGKDHWFRDVACIRGGTNLPHELASESEETVENGNGTGSRKPFALDGDSGAVVIDEQGNVVGMLFAGADNYAFAFPLKSAFESLGCELITSG